MRQQLNFQWSLYWRSVGNVIAPLWANIFSFHVNWNVFLIYFHTLSCLSSSRTNFQFLFPCRFAISSIVSLCPQKQVGEDLIIKYHKPMNTDQQLSRLLCQVMKQLLWYIIYCIIYSGVFWCFLQKNRYAKVLKFERN